MPSLSKWHVWWVVSLTFACILLSTAAWRRHRAAPGRVTLSNSPAPIRNSVGAIVAPVDGPIYVHVTGDVAKPGLYRMPAGSRVMDAISYAGGAKETADLNSLNLATPLRDGQKLTVPSQGEQTSADSGAYLTDSPSPPPQPPVLVKPDPPSPQPRVDNNAQTGLVLSNSETTDQPAHTESSAKFKQPGDGTVDLNSATTDQLQHLPGVGPTTAQRIIDYREAHGGFSTVEELMEVKGIGPAKLRKMQPFVVVRDSRE